LLNVVISIHDRAFWFLFRASPLHHGLHEFARFQNTIGIEKNHALSKLSLILESANTHRRARISPTVSFERQVSASASLNISAAS
jgi:hypothetical protein